MAVKERNSGMESTQGDSVEIPPEPDHIILPDQDSILFTNALENPPEPNAYLIQAMRDYYGKA